MALVLMSRVLRALNSFAVVLMLRLDSVVQSFKVGSNAKQASANFISVLLISMYVISILMTLSLQPDEPIGKKESGAAESSKYAKRYLSSWPGLLSVLSENRVRLLPNNGNITDSYPFKQKKEQKQNISE